MWLTTLFSSKLTALARRILQKKINVAKYALNALKYPLTNLSYITTCQSIGNPICPLNVLNPIWNPDISKYQGHVYGESQKEKRYKFASPKP